MFTILGVFLLYTKSSIEGRREVRETGIEQKHVGGTQNRQKKRINYSMFP